MAPDLAVNLPSVWRARVLHTTFYANPATVFRFYKPTNPNIPAATTPEPDLPRADELQPRPQELQAELWKHQGEI